MENTEEDDHLLIFTSQLKILPWWPLEETNKADTVVSNFEPPEMQENKFLLFKPLSQFRNTQDILGTLISPLTELTFRSIRIQ